MERIEHEKNEQSQSKLKSRQLKNKKNKQKKAQSRETTKAITNRSNNNFDICRVRSRIDCAFDYLVLRCVCVCFIVARVLLCDLEWGTAVVQRSSSLGAD